MLEVFWRPHPEVGRKESQCFATRGSHIPSGRFRRAGLVDNLARSIRGHPSPSGLRYCRRDNDRKEKKEISERSDPVGTVLKTRELFISSGRAKPKSVARCEIWGRVLDSPCLLIITMHMHGRPPAPASMSYITLLTSFLLLCAGPTKQSFGHPSARKVVQTPTEAHQLCRNATPQGHGGLDISHDALLL